MANYIKFVEVNVRDGRRTSVWAVLSLDGSKKLGHVSWYGAWRKYSFMPYGMTVFEQECLRYIADFCEAQTKAHRSKPKAIHRVDGDHANNYEKAI